MNSNIPNLPLPRSHLVRHSMWPLLAGLEKIGFISWREQPTRLKSGIMSNVYVAGRNDLTEHPEQLRAVGKLVAQVVREISDKSSGRVPLLIGIPTAGTAMTVAASLNVEYGGFPHRIMREKKKKHGANLTWVDGEVSPNAHEYMTLDNDVTDGGSKLEMRDRLREDGYPVDGMKNIVLVDRQQGARKRLAKEGVDLTAIFNLLDVVWAFGELGIWKPDRVMAVEYEIAEHQIA